MKFENYIIFDNVEVTLEYAEPGMGFAGITSWGDGKEIDRQEIHTNNYCE